MSRAKRESSKSSTQFWVDMLLINDCEPDEKLDRIVRDAASMFEVPIAMINLLTSDHIVFKACVGEVRGDCLDRDGSFCDIAISREPPLSVVDATKDARFKDYIIVTNELQIRSYFGKSLHAPDGTRIGTICLLDTKPRDYTKLQGKVLDSLASSAEAEINTILRQVLDAEALQDQQVLLPMPPAPAQS